MGLDMNAYSCAAGESEQEKGVELFYWRKHPDLHGWMERLYRSKGGTDEFNCVSVELTSDDLDALERDVNASALPHTTGFFFGSSGPFREEEDLRFIALAREQIEQGRSVHYTSWW